jgi:hypothetical protein
MSPIEFLVSLYHLTIRFGASVLYFFDGKQVYQIAQIAREWVMLNICIFAIARADITKPIGSFFIYFFIAPTIHSIVQFSQQSWLLVYLQ